MRSRRAVTLVELLVTLSVLTIAAVSTGPLLRDMLLEIPRTQRALNGDAVLSDVLRQLRGDVERADTVTCTEDEDGTARVALTSGDGTVLGYLVRPDEVKRLGPGEDARRWELRDGLLRIRPWEADGRVCGLEVRSAVRYRADGRVHERLARTHLLLLRPTGKEDER